MREKASLSKSLFHGAPEISTAGAPRAARVPHWQPFDCESCNLFFDPGTWHADWSLSGELTWDCPKCGHPNFPRLD